MFLSFSNKANKRAAWDLYNAAVAQARRSEFYTAYDVPDSVAGRFDLLSLHVALLVRRLNGEGAKGIALAQSLFDRMFVDMDRSMRERGVGDLSVPKKMKWLMTAFNGRCLAYATALEAENGGALLEVVQRNIFANEVPPGMAEKMVGYIRNAAAVLATQQTMQIIKGQVFFPGELEHEQDAGYSSARLGMVA